VHPQAEQESILGHLLLGGGDLEVYLVDLDCLLKATTEKCWLRLCGDHNYSSVKAKLWENALCLFIMGWAIY